MQTAALCGAIKGWGFPAGADETPTSIPVESTGVIKSAAAIEISSETQKRILCGVKQSRWAGAAQLQSVPRVRQMDQCEQYRPLKMPPDRPRPADLMVNAQQSATWRNWSGNWVAQQSADLTTAQRVWNGQTESQTSNDTDWSPWISRDETRAGDAPATINIFSTTGGNMLFALMQILAIAFETKQPAPCSVIVLKVSNLPNKWERWRPGIGW